MLPCPAVWIIFPKGNKVGNAMVAKLSVLNSLTTLPSIDGHSNGSFSFTVSLTASLSFLCCCCWGMNDGFIDSKRGSSFVSLAGNGSWAALHPHFH